MLVIFLSIVFTIQLHNASATKATISHPYYISFSITNNLDDDQQGYFYIMRGTSEVTKLYMNIPAHTTLNYNQDPFGYDPQYPMLYVALSESTYGKPPYSCTAYFKAYDYDSYGYIQTSTTGYMTLITDNDQYNVAITINKAVDNGIDDPPKITVTSPTEGQEVKGNLMLSGTATDDYGVARIDVSNDMTNWQTIATANQPYPKTATWDYGPLDTTQAPDGVKTLYFRAYDGLQYSTAKKITFAVKNTQVPLPPQNNPPTVSIDSPSSNSVVRNVTSIMVSATDPDGDNIQYIRIYINDTLIENVTSSSYTYQWNTSKYADGVYAIKANASDGKNISETASIVVTVNNTPLVIEPAVNKPPKVNISSPLNGTNVNGTINVVGNASDTDGTVRNVSVKIGSGQWREASDLSGIKNDWSSWNFTLNTTLLSNGNYTIYARAIDSNNSIEIAEATIKIVNNHRPTISISSPFNGSFADGTTQISGTSFDEDADDMIVEIRIDNGSWENVSVTSTGKSNEKNWTYQWNTTTTTDGNHTISVRSSDRLQPSDVKDIVLKVKNQRPPICAILYPSANSSLSDTITIAGSAFDINGDNLTLTFGLLGGQIGSKWFIVENSTRTQNGTYYWNYTLDTTSIIDGVYSLVAKANDSHVDSTLSRVIITVKNTKPQCKIKEPVEGTLFKNETMDAGIRIVVEYNVSVAAMDPIVEIKIDNGGWGRATQPSSNTAYYDWDTTNAGDGIHKIYARVYDGSEYSPIDVVNIALRNYQPPSNITILQNASPHNLVITSITFSRGFSPERLETINISTNESVRMGVDITNNGSSDVTGIIILYANYPDRNKDGVVDYNASIIASKIKTITAKGNDSFETSWSTAEIGNYTIYAMLIEGFEDEGRLYQSKGVISVLPPLPNIEIDKVSVQILNDINDQKNATNIIINNKVYIKIVVKNSGTGNMQDSTRIDIYDIFDNEKLIDNRIVPALNSTEQNEIYAGWVPETAGTHRIKVVVDTRNKIIESNEDDNSFTFSVDVTSDVSPPYGESLLFIVAIVAGVILAAIPLIVVLRKWREEKKLL
jgi:hypothetical protein